MPDKESQPQEPLPFKSVDDLSPEQIEQLGAEQAAKRERDEKALSHSLQQILRDPAAAPVVRWLKNLALLRSYDESNPSLDRAAYIDGTRRLAIDILSLGKIEL